MAAKDTSDLHFRKTACIFSCPYFDRMPFDQERSLQTVQRLSRRISKLASKPAPDSVHKFRTYSRRVEVLLKEIVPDRRRNEKKLLKLLRQLRRKAGRVRDLDTQISALRSLRIPQEPGRKSQLMRTLVEERAKREKKLGKAFDKKTVAEVRKRLQRAQDNLEIPPDIDPVALALRRVTALGLDHAPLTEKTLHQYRIAGKRARYVAELAGDTPRATQLIQLLKPMQDVIGDWHDWLQLAQKAQQLFGGVQESALVAALRNVTGAKFRQAADALAQTRAVLGNQRPALTPAARKPQTPVTKVVAAVA